VAPNASVIVVVPAVEVMVPVVVDVEAGPPGTGMVISKSETAALPKPSPASNSSSW